MGETNVAATEQPDRMRRGIAATMTASASIPQFSLERDIEVSFFEERLAGVIPSDPTTRPTIGDAVTAVLARALPGHPAFMRSWIDDVFHLHHVVNMGVAVALPDGLVTPVIAGADRLGVGQLAGIRRSLQHRLGAGERLSPAEATGATFTITNLGALGIDRFTALVNPPQSGILAIGRTRSLDGGRVLTLTLTADHRVADGAHGARLLAEVADGLTVEARVDALLAL